MDSKDEQALVARAKSNPEAFGRLFDLYYPKILGYLVRRTGDIQLAHDLASETFIKALRKLHTFTWRGAPIESWLFAIAANELRMHFRKTRKIAYLEDAEEKEDLQLQAETDLEQELQDAQDKLERDHLFHKAQKLLRGLPQKYQEVLVLRYSEQKKIKDIAVTLKKSEGTVKSLLSRGLALLRRQMQMQPNDKKSIVHTEGRLLQSAARKDYER